MNLSVLSTNDADHSFLLLQIMMVLSFSTDVSSDSDWMHVYRELLLVGVENAMHLFDGDDAVVDDVHVDLVKLYEPKNSLQ